MSEFKKYFFILVFICLLFNTYSQKMPVWFTEKEQINLLEEEARSVINDLAIYITGIGNEDIRTDTVDAIFRYRENVLRFIPEDSKNKNCFPNDFKVIKASELISPEIYCDFLINNFPNGFDYNLEYIETEYYDGKHNTKKLKVSDKNFYAKIIALRNFNGLFKDNHEEKQINLRDTIQFIFLLKSKNKLDITSDETQLLFYGNLDSDNDTYNDNIDECPNNPNKIKKGICGCDEEVDSDSDGVPDCKDGCPNKEGKLNGCPDSDNDGTEDRFDECPNNPNRIRKGICGCDEEVDSDGDGVPDCKDGCPNKEGKLNGCPDSDNDGTEDRLDECPNNSNRIKKGICGCEEEVDSDDDGVPDCKDDCPEEKGSIKKGGCPVGLKTTLDEIKRNVSVGVNYSCSITSFKENSTYNLSFFYKILRAEDGVTIGDDLSSKEYRIFNLNLSTYADTYFNITENISCGFKFSYLFQTQFIVIEDEDALDNSLITTQPITTAIEKLSYQLFVPEINVSYHFDSYYNENVHRITIGLGYHTFLNEKYLTVLNGKQGKFEFNPFLVGNIRVTLFEYLELGWGISLQKALLNNEQINYQFAELGFKLPLSKL